MADKSPRYKGYRTWIGQRFGQREAAGRRGYGGRWQRYRRWYLGLHPLCVACLAHGRTTASEVVDHVRPINGPRDPLFWAEQNHQALCRACHEAKHGRRRPLLVDATFGGPAPLVDSTSGGRTPGRGAPPLPPYLGDPRP